MDDSSLLNRDSDLSMRPDHFARWDVFFSLSVALVPAILASASGFGASREVLIETAEEGTLIGKILYGIIFLLAFVLLVRFRLHPVWSKFVYILLLYLSFGVTYSDYPGNVVRGLFVACSSLMLWSGLGQILARRYASKNELLMGSVIQFLIGLGILELILWWVRPFERVEGFMADYLGFILQPNLLAKLLCVGIIFVFVRLLSTRGSKRFFGEFVLLMVLLLLTGSRTSLLAVGLVLTFLFLKTAYVSKRIKLVYLGLVSIGVILGFQFVVDYFTKGDELGVLYQSSFSFRLSMWEDLLPMMLTNSYLGAGLNSFWNPDLYSTIPVVTAGVHNGYLQVFQDLGIIGLALTIMIHVPLWRSLRARYGTGANALLRSALVSSWVFFLIVNLTEGDLGNYRSSLWAFLMMLSIAWFYWVRNAQVQR